MAKKQQTKIAPPQQNVKVLPLGDYKPIAKFKAICPNC